MADALVRQIAVRVLDPVLDMDWSQLEFKIMREGTVRLKDVNLKKDFVRKIIPEGAPMHIEDVSVRSGELDVKWTLGKAITAFLGSHTDIPATLTLYGVTIDLVIDLDAEAAAAAAAATVADAAAKGGSAATGDPTGDAEATEDDGWSPGPDEGQEGSGGRGAGSRAVAVMSALGGGRFAEAGKITVDGEADDEAVASLPRDPQLWRTLEAAQQEARQVQEARMTRYDKQPASAASATQRLTATAMRILEQSAVVVLRDLRINVRYVSGAAAAPFEAALSVDSVVLDASQPPPAFTEAVKGLERRARHFWTRTLSVTGLAVSLTPLQAADSMAATASLVGAMSRRAKVARLRAAKAAALRLNSAKVGRERAAAAGGGAGAVKWGPGTGVIPGGAGGESGLAGELWAAGEGEDEIGAPVVDGESTDDDDDDDDDSDRGGDGANAAAAHAGGARVRGTRRRGLGHRRGEDETGSGRGGGDMDEEAEARSPLASRARADRRTLTPRRSSSSADTGELREEDLLVPAPAPAGHDEADAWDILRKTTLRVSATRQVGPIDSAAHPAEVSAEAHIGVLEMRLHERQAECLVAFADDVKAWKAKATSGGDDNGSGSSSGRDAAVARPSQIRASGSGAEGDTAEGASQGGSVGHGPSGKRRQAVPDPQGPASLRGLSASADTVLMAEYSALARRFFWRPSVARCVPKVARVDAILRRLESVVVPPFTPEPFVVVTAKPLSPLEAGSLLRRSSWAASRAISGVTTAPQPRSVPQAGRRPAAALPVPPSRSVYRLALVKLVRPSPRPACFLDKTEEADPDNWGNSDSDGDLDFEGADDGTLGDSSDYGDGSREHNGEGDGDEDGELVGGPDDDDGGEQLRGHSRGRHRRAGGGRGAASGRGGRRAEAEARLADRQAAAMHSLRRMHRLEQALAARGGKASIVACRTIAEEELRAEFRARYQRQIMQAALASSRGLVCGGDAQRHEEYSVSLSASLSAEADASAAMARLMREQSSALGPEARTGAQTKASGPAGMVALPLVSWCALRGDFLQAMSASGARGGGAASAAAADAIVNRALMRASADDLAGVVFACPQLMLSAGDAAVPGRGGIPGARVAASAAAAAATVAMSAASSGWARLATGKTPPPSAAASPIASGRSGHSDDESGAASAAPSSDGSAGEEAQPHDSGPVEPPQPRSFRWLRDTAKFRWRALRRFQRATTAGRLEAVRSLRQELEVDLAPVVAAVRVAQCAVADSPALARALALPAQRLGSADRASLPSRRSRAAGSTARSRPTDSSAADRGWKMPQQWPVLGAAVRGRIDGGAPAAASAGAAASVGPWAGGVLARQGGVPWLAEAGTDDSSFVLPRAAAAALYASRFRSLAARGHSDLPDGYQRYAFQLSVSHAGAEIVSRAGTPLARLAVDSVSLGASDRKDACRDLYLAVGRVNVTADPGIDAEASSGLGRSLVRALSAVAVMRPRAIQAPRLSAEHCGGGEPRDEPEHGSARRSSGLSATRSTAGSLAGSEAGRRVAQDNRLSPTWGGGGRQAPPQAGSRLLEGAVGGKGSTLPTVARGVRVWAGTTTAAELAASAARAIFGCGTAAWVQSLADPGLALAGDSWSSLDREVGRALRMAGLSHTRGGFRDHARWVAIARELDAAEELTVPGSEARETAAHARRLDLPLHHLALAGDGPPTPPGSRSDSNGRTRGGGHGRRGRAKQAEDATPSSASEVLPAGARSAWRVLQHATAKFFESVPSLRAMLLDEDICAAMVAFARARAEALLADPEVEAKDCEGPLGLHPLTADGGRWAGLVDAGSELRVDLIKPAVGNAQAVSSLGSGRGALGAAAGDGDGRFVPSPGFAGGAAAAASAGGGGGGSRRLAALKVVEAAVYPRSRALDGGFRTPSLAAPELQASRFVESVTNRMDEPRRGCLRGPGSFGGLPSVPSVRRREAVLNISSPVSQTPIPGPDSRLAGASAARWNRWLLASVGAELVLLARHLETCLSNTDPADLIAVAQTMLRSRFLRRSAAAGAMVPSRFYIHIEALVPHTRPPQPDAAGAVAALPAPGALHSRPGSSTTAVAWTLSRLRSGLAFLAAGSDDEMDVDGRRASATAGVAATSEGGAPAMAGGTARESGVRELRQLLELLAAFTMELIDIAVAAPFLDSQWCPFARAFAWRAAAVDRPLTPSLPRVEVLRALQGRFAFLDRKRRELLARVAFGVQEALMAAASRAPGHGGRGGARAAARPQSPGALGSPGEPAPHGSASQATAAAAAAASFGQGKGRAGSEAGAADSSPPSKSAAHSAADGSRETFLDDADRVMVAADATRAAKLLRSRSVSSRQWDVGTGAAATSRLWSAGYLGTLGLRSRGSLLDGTSLHPLMEQAVEDGAGVMHPAESLLLGRASEPGSLPVYTMRHVLLVRASTSGQAGGVLDEGDPDDVMVGAVLPRLMAAETVALAGLPAAMAATAANSGHVESASADRLHQAAVDAIHAVADGDVPWTYRALRSAAIDAAGCAAKESVTVADLDEQLGRVAEAAVAQASATTDMESAGWAARSQHWQEGQEAASSAKDRLRELPRQLSALPEGGTCLAQGKFRMAILHEAADDEASLAGGLLGRVADWVPVHVEVDSSGKWLRCYRSRSTTRAEATAKAPISAGVMVLSGEALAARGGRPAKNPAATGFGGLWGSAPAVSSEVVANNGMCIMDPPAMSDGAMRALLLVADTVEERERWCGLLRACVQADEAERAMTEDSLLREVAAQRIARETDSGPPGHGAEGGGGSGDTHGILATLSRLGGAPPTLRPGYGAELARRDWQLSAGDWRRTRQAVVRVRLAPTAVTLCPGLFASALAFARRIHIERLVRPASDASDPGNASSGSVGDESGTGKLASVAMLVSRTKASTKRHRGAGSRPDVANLSSLFGADASGEEGSKRGDEIAPERGAGHAVRAGSHAQLLQGPLGTIAEEEADAPERRSGSLRRPGRPERRQPDWLGLSAGDGGALSDGSSVDSDSEDDDALVLDAADSQPGSTKKGQAAAAKASGKGHLVLSLVMDRFQFAVGAVENTAAEQRAAKRDAQGGVPSSGPAEDLDDPASLPRRAKEAGPRFTGVRLVVSSIALRRFQLVAPPSPAEGDLGTGAASARRAADEVQRLVRSGLGSGEATGQAGKADARWPERVMRVHVSMGKLCLTPDLTTAAFAMQWAARAQAIASRLAPAAAAGAGVPEPKPGPAPAGSSLLVATVSLHAGVSVRLSAYNSPILHVSLLPARVRASVFTPATLRRDASVAGSRSTQLAADVNGISVVLCRSTDWFVRPIARAEAAHPSAASMRAAAPDPADADPWARLSPAQALARRVWLRRRLLRPAVSDLCAAGVHAAAPDRRLTDALFWSAGLVYDGVQDLEAVQHARDKSREAFEAAVEIAAAVQRDPFLCPAAVQAASAQAMPAVWSGVEGGVVRLAVERMRLELRQSAPPTEAAGELARDSMGGASASHDVESGTGLASDADDRSEDSSDQRPSPAGSPAEGAGSSAGDAKDGEATPEGPPARHRGTGRSDSSGGRASMEVSVALERLTLLVEPDPRGVPPGARRCLYHSDPGPEEERGAHHRSATSAADTWRRARAMASTAPPFDRLPPEPATKWEAQPEEWGMCVGLVQAPSESWPASGDGYGLVAEVSAGDMDLTADPLCLMQLNQTVMLFRECLRCCEREAHPKAARRPFFATLVDERSTSVASSQPHPAADAATVLSTDDLLADSDAQAATGGASPTLSSDPAGSAAPRASAEVLGAAKPSPLQPAPRLAEQAGVLGRLSVSFSVSQRDAAIVWTELAMPRLPTRMAALSALLRKDRSRGGEKSIAREDVLFALDTALPPRPPAKRAAGEGRAGAGPSAGAAHASPLPSAPTARDARFSATAFAAFSRRPGTDGVLLSLRDHVAATHEAEAASALPGHLRRAPAPSRSPMVLQDPSLSLDLPLSWCALDVYDARHDVSAPADPSLVLSGLLAAVARRAQLGSGVASDGSQGPPAPFGMHPEGIPPGLDGEATLSGLPLWDDEVSEAQGALGMFADEEDEHAMRNLEAGAGASSLSSVVGLGSSGTMREMGVEGETLGLGIDPHARVDRGGFRASQPRTGVLGDAGARREASGAAVADEGNLRAREADVERREAAMDKAAQIVSSMAGESWMTLRRLETPIGLAAEAAGEDAGLGQSRGVDMVGAPQWARRRVARLGRAQLPPRGPGCDQQVVDRRRTIQIQLYMRDTRICYVPRFVNEVLAIQLSTMEAAYGRTVWRLGDLPPPPMIGFSHVVMEARRLEVLVPPGSRADDPVLRTRMGSMSMEMSLESHSFEAAAASAAGSAIQSGRSLRRSRPTKAIDMQVLNVRSMTDVVVDQPPADELPLVPSTARGRAAESVSDHGFVMAIPWVSVSVTEPFGQLNKLACPLQRLTQVQISPASVTMTSAVPVLVNLQQSVMGAMRELSPTIRNASRPFAEHANLTMSSQQLGSGSGGGAASGGAGSTADSPGSVMQVTLREQVQPDRLPELREQPFPDDPFVLLPHRFFPDFACLAPAGLFSTRVPEGSAASAGEELCRRAQAHRLHRLAQRGAGEPDSPIPLFLSPDALATAASDAEAGGMAGHAALLGMSLSVLLGTPMERPPDQPDDDQLGLGSEWTASPARSAPGAPWVAESPPRSPHSQGRFALATSPAGGLGELAADPAGFLSRESALTSRSMLDSGADGSAQDQLAAITDELCQVGLQGAEVSALQGLASREGEAPGHLPSELAVSSTQASVLEAAAAALRRAMESSDAAGGASKALEAVARVAQLLEAAQGPARRTELAAEEQAAMLADQNAFLLGQLLGEQPAAPDE
ncbi:hypothetical protein FNF28_06120 [Cafeteria roenbergensis]|uniref:Uncharacterized protein n=1 Tax=Cafeteria roenbergensis TaxID=33653 RepID=A0A5A8D0G0_CAFRO|nr:hypothetical protein FNF28_06120 [Cafeteria roenbergensis]